MGQPLNFASISVVKHALACAWLGNDVAGPASLGAITLRPHQRDAVARLLHTLERNRVALLADDVGLGKTYVAIAVAATARAPLIVAPASLRDMWRDALRAAAVQVRWISYEQLSRSAPDTHDRPDLVILDEAHHARTPSTHRYERLAALVSGARLLLLSATPIHNRRDDLTALFALALGRPARSLDDEAIAARTIRRTQDDVPAVRLPELGAREWIRVPDDDDLLQRMLALPPPLPPRAAGEAGVLLGWTLVRLWASTRGALRSALRRRLQRGWALRQALASGVYPTLGELAAWQCSDHAVQLAFPELIASRSDRPQELLAALDRHLAGIEDLLGYLASTPNPDIARAEALRTIRRGSPGERILVFTQFADSAAALWRLLRTDAGVAVLTSRGAEVAGGHITRREALRRFAPGALNLAAPAQAETIALLLSTDLLSEGVNLQDASILVHLDLPWTHARLAQRVGRVRRMGSAHPTVRVFTFAPPAPTERLLDVERRIAGKLAAAARTLGIAGAILPSLVDHAPEEESPTRAAEHLRMLLSRWRSPMSDAADPADGPVTAIVRGERSGALAAVVDQAERITLVAANHDAITDDPRRLLAVCKEIEGAPPSVPDEALARRECRRIVQWMEARAADHAVGGAISIEGAARRATLRRLATILSRTPLARRHETASLAAEARRIAGSAIGVGGELILGQLAAAPMSDDAWLRAVAAFASAHGRCDIDPPTSDHSRVIALVVILAESGSSRPRGAGAARQGGSSFVSPSREPSAPDP